MIAAFVVFSLFVSAIEMGMFEQMEAINDHDKIESAARQGSATDAHARPRPAAGRRST